MTRIPTAAGIAGLLIAAGLLPACADRQAERTQPNIVLVLADDLGYGDLSSYGQRHFETPHIDRLAAEGVRFTDHYAGAPVCAPSRCALMTGLHTGHCRVRANFGLGPDSGDIRVSLEDGDMTVAEVLGKAGYRTALFGKWGLGEAGTAGVPWRRGFDRFAGFLSQANAHNHYPPAYWLDGKHVAIPENVNESSDDDIYIDDLLAGEAIEFIRRGADAPFFLFYAPTLPHSDMTVPEDSIAPFRGRFPPAGYEEAHYVQDDVHAAYAGMVTRLDGYVGRILDVLDEEGMADNTVVVFVSDNGPHASDGYNPEFFASAGPLRGRKSFLYEGGIRVPLLVRWPGRAPAGGESGHVSAFWDFLPTLAEIAGADGEIRGDGVSMLPALLGEEAGDGGRVLYWEYGHHRFGGQQALRRGDIKAYRRDPDEPMEIFDLGADIAETGNIAAQHPELVEEFDRLFEAFREEDPLYPLIRPRPR